MSQASTHEVNQGSEIDSNNQRILDLLRAKTTVKMQVYDNTFEVFNQLKETLHEMVNDLNPLLHDLDRRIRLEYRDKGKFEAEVRIANDILLLSMHTNVFQFDRSHSAMRLAYVENHPENAYCGIISMYNFLADSFKYNRIDDLGYLVGRLFINRERSFMVEGKRQVDYGVSNFGQAPITKEAVACILQTAIRYTLEFDLLAPPYDMMKVATVAQMNTKLEHSKMQTGKRLGFKFNSDDIGA